MTVYSSGYLYVLIITAAKKNSLGLPPFLTSEEAAIVLARIEHDRGDAVEQKPTFKLYMEFLKDWKMWEFPLYLLLNVRFPLWHVKRDWYLFTPEHCHHCIRLLPSRHSQGRIRLLHCTSAGHDFPTIPARRLRTYSCVSAASSRLEIQD